MQRLLFVVSMLISGCAANPYTEFYRANLDGPKVPGYIEPTGALQIYTSSDFGKDRLALMQRGFIQVGVSSFNANAAKVGDAQLREQAKNVGAQLVLVASNYTGTVSGARPLVLPTVNTSYTTGNATAYGAGGPVNVYGNATTTTYGTQTTMIPYTIQRSDFTALYFIKQQARLGIFPAKIDEETRRRRESNIGVLAQVIVDGSPAYLADILPGDLIVRIGSDPVQSPENFMELVNKYQGQAVTIGLERGDRGMEKQVQIRDYGNLPLARGPKH